LEGGTAQYRNKDASDRPLRMQRFNVSAPVLPPDRPRGHRRLLDRKFDHLVRMISPRRRDVGNIGDLELGAPRLSSRQITA